jgi:hypothetical protein
MDILNCHNFNFIYLFIYLFIIKKTREKKQGGNVRTIKNIIIII